MTNNIGRRAMLGATFATLTCVAVAQPTMGPGRGHGGPGMMGGHGGGMMRSWDTGSYLDALKTQLGITENQEPAWKDYADTVSGVAEQMQGLHQIMFDSMGTASWQERRTMMNNMFEGRKQAFDQVHEAANRLLPALDPAQRAKAQGTLPGLAYGPGMMGHH